MAPEATRSGLWMAATSAACRSTRTFPPTSRPGRPRPAAPGFSLARFLLSSAMPQRRGRFPPGDHLRQWPTLPTPHHRHCFPEQGTAPGLLLPGRRRRARPAWRKSWTKAAITIGSPRGILARIRPTLPAERPQTLGSTAWPALVLRYVRHTLSLAAETGCLGSLALPGHLRPLATPRCDRSGLTHRAPPATPRLWRWDP